MTVNTHPDAAPSVSTASTGQPARTVGYAVGSRGRETMVATPTSRL